MRAQELLRLLREGQFDERLAAVFASKPPDEVYRRIESVVDGFCTAYDPAMAREVMIFSAPGRTELGGNHTDHQGGCVLAGSVDMDTIACVARSEGSLIRVLSRGHRAAEIDASDPAIHREERGNSASLVRGVAAHIGELGYDVGGFDAYTETQVLRGSGLSSSAAFEVLLGQIVNDLSCDGTLDATRIAQIGQYAENVYYGKPCGLMDQMACATGGVIAIDFADPAAPVVRRCSVDFAREGYALVIIDSGATHANLDDEYAAIPNECCAVAVFFGKGRLRDVDERSFWASRSKVLAACGERPTLRAEHFFAETKRAVGEYEALERGDFRSYLALVRESGESSERKLQNVSLNRPGGDRLLKVIHRARELAGEDGAARVHGGGFAGTAQAYVPLERLEAFTAQMESEFGAGCCHVVQLRNTGSTRIL